MLTPGIARTLYNVADALEPGGRTDVLAEMGVPALRLRLLLRALEWRSRLRYGRGYSWQPRERRRALLESWPGSRVRRRVERALVRAQSRAEGA